MQSEPRNTSCGFFAESTVCGSGALTTVGPRFALCYFIGMWPFAKKQKPLPPVRVYFENTLTGKKDLFVSMKPGRVLMYSCGPTVYGPQHIGNLRAALFADVIARVLASSGYVVTRVNNITDVGHLVGDGDEGEDKMAVGAKQEHSTPKTIADKYTQLYLADIKKLNIPLDDIQFPRATEYIKEQIAMVQALEQKGFTYRTKEGVYFDTSKYPDYGKLGGIAQVKLLGGARIKMEEGKRSLHDFLLWRVARMGDLQQWDSPWGRGNPGWHIECSAMIRALLGTEIDIHTGGMDHIPVHHNNEIAQSECANGRVLAHFWLHEAMITIEGEKIAKSLGNVVLLSDIEERGYDPLALRYLYLQAHFRTPMSFTWEGLAAAHSALVSLSRLCQQIEKEAEGEAHPSLKDTEFLAIARDDLALPQALAFLHETLKDEAVLPEEKLSLIKTADAILGLSLLTPRKEEVPQEIMTLVQERASAKEAKDYARADEIRIHIEERGYAVEDTATGTAIRKQQ